MTIIFFIYSETVDINNYTIKDIPGSSGRLDVISRCVLAAIVGDNKFDENIQVWVFLNKLGTYVFDSNVLNYGTFPKNELMFTDYFVKIIRNRNSTNKLENNPLRLVSPSEKGNDFFCNLNRIILEKEVIFIVGNQSGDIMNLEEVLMMNLPNLSLGNRSYLASSIIRLIKLNLLTPLQ